MCLVSLFPLYVSVGPITSNGQINFMLKCKENIALPWPVFLLPFSVHNSYFNTPAL